MMNVLVEAFFCRHCGANMIAPGVRARCATLSMDGACPNQSDICLQCALQRCNLPASPRMCYPRMTMSRLPDTDTRTSNANSQSMFAVVRVPNTGTESPGDQRYLFCIDCAYSIVIRDWYEVRAKTWERRHRNGASWSETMMARSHSSAAQRLVNAALRDAPLIECFVAL